MSEDERCVYCGGKIEEEVIPSDTCEGCWYGMRLEPEAWEARLRAKGIRPIHQGGCIISEYKGGFMIECRSPYKPGLRIVKNEEE